MLLCTLMCQVVWTAGLIYGSMNLIQSHAYVFNNIHGLFVVFIIYLMGQRPVIKEWQGVALALIGCALMLFDPKAERESSSVST